MANVNDELGELEAFGDAVGRVSGGRLRIKWLNEYGRGRDGNAEVNLIRDVNAGKADLGWAGTRVFDELGDAAFNPLHAPMLIDSYELEEKVLERRARRPDAREPRRARAPGHRRPARPAAPAARQASAARSRRLGRRAHQRERRRAGRAALRSLGAKVAATTTRA